MHKNYFNLRSLQDYKEFKNEEVFIQPYRVFINHILQNIPERFYKIKNKTNMTTKIYCNIVKLMRY